MIVFVAVFLSCFEVSVVHAEISKSFEFSYSGRIWQYECGQFKKSSTQFDLDYELNKYGRFDSYENRKILLLHMIKIGFSREVAVEYLYPGLVEKINQIEKNINILPKSASLKIDSNAKNVFNITNEIVGLRLNRDKLFEDIYNAHKNDTKLSFKLPVEKICPQCTSNDFKKFTNLRADFSTNISHSSEDRKHNIKNALNALNKIEISPGQLFSFNKTTGKRTEENGFRTAKIIVNNEFVDGVGGGVCQVSSTLYNSALLAGLEIVEANKHSKQVSYVRYGFDAMVNFGSSDLKFKNNTSEKITIITNFSADNIRIRIFGESMGKTKYKLTNEIINVEKPTNAIVEYDEKGEYADKVLYTDEYFYLKTAQDGMEIKSYREKLVDNISVEKMLLRHDKFKVQNALIIYGTKKKNDNIISILENLENYD